MQIHITNRFRRRIYSQSQNLPQRFETRKPIARWLKQYQDCGFWIVKHVCWGRNFENGLRKPMLCSSRNDSRQEISWTQFWHMELWDYPLRHDLWIPPIRRPQHKQTLQENSQLWLPDSRLHFKSIKRSDKESFEYWAIQEVHNCWYQGPRMVQLGQTRRDGRYCYWKRQSASNRRIPQ